MYMLRMMGFFSLVGLHKFPNKSGLNVLYSLKPKHLIFWLITATILPIFGGKLSMLIG